jgi:hypothetical protein
MYSQDTINQFIELRAEDKPLRDIAKQLNISLGLAWKWTHQHEPEIEQLVYARKEALRQQYLGRFEDKLADMARELQNIDAELKMRDFEDVSTEFLLYRKTCLQARMEKAATLREPRPPAVNSAEEAVNKSVQA